MWSRESDYKYPEASSSSSSATHGHLWSLLEIQLNGMPLKWSKSTCFIASGYNLQLLGSAVPQGGAFDWWWIKGVEMWSAEYKRNEINKFKRVSGVQKYHYIRVPIVMQQLYSDRSNWKVKECRLHREREKTQCALETSQWIKQNPTEWLHDSSTIHVGLN